VRNYGPHCPDEVRMVLLPDAGSHCERHWPWPRAHLRQRQDARQRAARGEHLR
jgi:hypothetical protein